MCAEVRQVRSGELYRHFKGNIYRVLCVATHTEDSSALVIYEDTRELGRIWARPLEMFNSLVDKEKYPQASQKYRFEKI
ncbi:MAG: DUF1653 domain-containing protein [Clostridia bacterium]|nr:DUF1653 domain-containing protein [Clostridia bacterium]